MLLSAIIVFGVIQASWQQDQSLWSDEECLSTTPAPFSTGTNPVETSTTAGSEKAAIDIEFDGLHGSALMDLIQTAASATVGAASSLGPPTPSSPTTAASNTSTGRALILPVGTGPPWGTYVSGTALPSMTGGMTASSAANTTYFSPQPTTTTPSAFSGVSPRLLTSWASKFTWWVVLLQLVATFYI